ncbi:hypothetical protein MMC28_009859 [Mycoblastus sanguinarius]|nr:hypothetical protein [Mycoblastus sanguinarius]
MFSRLKTPILKNTGSVARDHLASERTFLAWLRTGLGFVALGVAVERFSQLDISPLQQSTAVPDQSTNRKDKADRSKGLVVSLMATGSCSIIYGATRYFSNMKMLENSLFKPSFHGAGGLSFAVIALTGVAYWSIIWEEGKEARR